MGMIAKYQYLSDKNLNKLKNFDTKNGEDIYDLELVEEEVEL